MGQQAIRHGVIDTDILVDDFRGVQQAALFLNTMRCDGGAILSAISAMELIAGCRDGSQLRDLKHTLAQFTVIHFTPAVSARAQELMEMFTLSHGLRSPDALVAATALESGLSLYSRNIRHFRMIPELLIIQPY